MKTKINYKALIPYFLCVVTYSFASIMNIELMTQIFIIKELTYNTLEQIYYYNLIGYILGSVFLLVFIKYFSIKKIIIFNLLVYIISVINLSFLDLTIRLIITHSMMYSATNIVVISILLLHVFNNQKINNTDAVSLFFLSFIVGYFLVDVSFYFKVYKTDILNLPLMGKLQLLNIIPLAIFLFIYIFAESFNLEKHNRFQNYLAIMKNIELELISSFVIFYILMNIIYGYEIHAITDSLLMISISDAKHYIFIAMLVTAIITPRFIFEYKAHDVNIICIIALLLVFSTMQFWGVNIIMGSIGWLFIGSALYLFFWNNLLILAKKFNSHYLQLSIILYILCGSVGYYCGYLTSDVSEDTIGKNSFLISICFVLFVLLAYYLFLYRKNNLREW